MVSRRTHPQDFGAASSHGTLWHTDSRAKRGPVQRPSNARSQVFLETRHKIGVAPSRFCITDGVEGRQAVNKRVKQFLFKCSRDFRVLNQFMPGFGETADL